jgi:hypothetical protein
MGEMEDKVKKDVLGKPATAGKKVIQVNVGQKAIRGALVKKVVPEMKVQKVHQDVKVQLDLKVLMEKKGALGKRGAMGKEECTVKEENVVVLVRWEVKVQQDLQVYKEFLVKKGAVAILGLKVAMEKTVIKDVQEFRDQKVVKGMMDREVQLVQLV